MAHDTLTDGQFQVAREAIARQLGGCAFAELDEHDRDLVDERMRVVAEPAEAIYGAWAEAVWDLSHLTRAEKDRVLQYDRNAPPSWRILEGARVCVFRSVQTRKGQPRVSAVIVDFGGISVLWVH